MKRLVVFTVLWVGLAWSAAAQMGGGPWGPGPGGLGPQPFEIQGDAQGQRDLVALRQALVRYLGLTPEQVTQWEQLWTTLRETLAPLHSQINTLQEQLRQLLGQNNPDPTLVGRLMLQLRTLHGQVEAAWTAYRTGFEALLTPEQLAKLRLLRGVADHPALIPACRGLGLCR
ncbi:MAG: periplasmic heavy metal sensor [Thermoanaerobaculum sp.]|nr:periplasmic heavy metal sensor [Thermoanaerobaculum sp.]